MQLSEEGHSVVIIDKNRDAFRRLVHFNGRTIHGSGFDRDVLSKAEAGQADALAAVTRGDNTNILCARIARDNYGIKNIVARIYDAQRAGIYMKLGIPTVATSLWTTQQVKRWIIPADDSVEWTDATATLHLVERIVPDHLAGKEFSNFSLGTSVRLVGLMRGGSGRIDVEGLFAQEDDVLEFLVTTQGLADLNDMLKVAAR
jgi:trk system potassium uptake protein TrkA